MLTHSLTNSYLPTYYLAMCAQMEVVASQKLKELEAGAEGDDYLSEEFYRSKVATSQYVFDALLPRTRSLARQMFTPIDSIMQMDKDHFSFDHAQ